MKNRLLPIAAAVAMASRCTVAPRWPRLHPRRPKRWSRRACRTTGWRGSRLSMKQQVEKDMFPGAVTLVARDGKVVHFEAHGFLDAAKSRPMTKDAIFRLASMTKPVVTVAGMMLVEQGAMKLNDPISNWLPELKDLKVETANGDVAPARPVTVQDLMRHTAGLVYGGSTRSPRIKEKYQDANIESSEVDITGDEMLKRLGQIPLAHQPGTFWEYSISVDVLGLLLERVAGKPLDKLLDDMLFKPLGMRDTAFWVRPTQQARLADTLDSDPQKATMNKAYRVLQDPSGKSYFKGGAGLVGTADDYLKFAQMMVNGGHFEGRRYLSRKTVEFMLSDHTIGMGGTTICHHRTGLRLRAGLRRAAAGRASPGYPAARATRCGRAPGAPASGSTRRNGWWAS